MLCCVLFCSVLWFFIDCFYCCYRYCFSSRSMFVSLMPMYLYIMNSAPVILDVLWLCTWGIFLIRRCSLMSAQFLLHFYIIVFCYICPDSPSMNVHYMCLSSLSVLSFFFLFPELFSHQCTFTKLFETFILHVFKNPLARKVCTFHQKAFPLLFLYYSHLLCMFCDYWSCVVYNQFVIRLH